MFKFNFSDGSDDESQTCLKRSKLDVHDSPVQRRVFDFKEVKPDDTKLKQNLPFKEYKLSHNVSLEYIDSSKLLMGDFIKGTSASVAHQQNSDLLPNVYEGGMQVWECTKDLLTYLIKQQPPFKQTTVLDLGCGHGLLGMYALKEQATEVHFQDYNEEVLTNTTMPNVLKVLQQKEFQRVGGTKESQDKLEGEEFASRCGAQASKQETKAQEEQTSGWMADQPSVRFFAGDWGKFCENFIFRYDYILTSETIYNVNNYKHVHNIFRQFLKPCGVCFVAAKCYYFGVGGSTREFRNFIENEGEFDLEIVKVFSEGAFAFFYL